ncbi:MAG: TetR family transcriptional regulator C-terminal domain-containing protein [Crocinitomicaceae bacterium]|nr:TetR family transcriptional regulator C-terminal domain-containing protein [Crocinitomicaceae bacterium]
MAKKEIDTRQVILDKYMDYVLMNSEAPKSVYAFAKENGMKEAEFYVYFSSFGSIDAHIFTLFFENTMTLLAKDEAFLEGDAKHKLLSFYFTFFEILTANRSFVIHILNNKDESKLKTMNKLKDLKKEFIQFVHTLDIEKLDLKMEKANKMIEKSISEAIFGQLILLIKFWMNDTSPAFEKTDVLIEKSVQAGFEMINTKPLESIIDLGKFLWKEHGFKK